MRIRTKLALVELIIVSGFMITLGIIFYTGYSIIKLKDFEIQSGHVLMNLNSINLKTESLLTTYKPLDELRNDWSNSIEVFEESLNELKKSRGTDFMGEDQIKQLKDTSGWWEQIFEWYYQPAFNHLNTIIEGELNEIIGSNGILQTRDKLQITNPDYRKYTGVFQTSINYHQLVQENNQVFIERFDVLLKDIYDQSNASARTSILVSSIALVITMLLALLVTILFSNRISGRIGLVEDAVRTMSSGDFSKELNIKSGDEFESLSQNYNVLKNELWQKLDSVLDFMLTIGGTITEGLNLDKMLQTVINSAVENSNADAGAIFMLNQDNTSLEVKAISGFFSPPYILPDDLEKSKNTIEEFFRKTPIIPGEGLIGDAVKQGEAFIIKDCNFDERMEFNAGVQYFLHINSIIIVPLIISRRILGVIAIIKQSENNYFTDIDYSHLKSFSDYATLTIDNLYKYTELLEKGELQREIGIAAEIQNNLLPRQLPEIKNASIAAFTNAAKGVSGDYYDVFRLNEDKIAILICDVAGKGVPAALLMVMIRTIIRLVSSPKKNPAEILTIINRSITGRIGTNQFATMGLFIFNEETGKAEYSNAAHSPLLLHRSSKNKFYEIDTPGLPIGVEEKESYRQKKFTLGKEDILVFYTDGIPEARNTRNQEFSYKSLLNIIQDNADQTPEDLIELLQEELTTFVGEAKQHDDQTLLIMKLQ